MTVREWSVPNDLKRSEGNVKGESCELVLDLI